MTTTTITRKIVLPPITKKSDHKSVAAVLITQGKHRFYTVTLPISILANTCTVSTRVDDPDIGFQRQLDEKRALRIAAYIDEGFGCIPTSIILSAQEASDFAYDSRAKTISFAKIPKAFLILDGQHRVYGFKKATSELRVPVVIFSGLSRVDEARLFIDINTEARPVPNELLLDIKNLAKYANQEEEFVRSVFDLLANDQSSCMRGLMSPAERALGKVSRVTFRRALRSIHEQLIESEPERVFTALNNYLNGVRLSLPNALDVNKTITNATVFSAVVSMFPKVSRLVRDRFDGGFELNGFVEVLKPLKTLKQSVLSKPPTSYAKLAEQLLGTLEKDNLRF
jgi:DGQHR domain-containing protein